MSTVLIDGIDIGTLDEDGLAELRNEAIGFVFQAHFLLEEFTCLENALMPIIIRDGDAEDDQRARVTTLLERVGLSHRLHAYPDAMSGGERQRCAIVRAHELSEDRARR